MVLDVVHYYLRRRLSTAAPILRSRCHDVCVCVGMLAWQNENPRLKWLETWHRSSLRDSAVKPVDFGFKRSRVSVSFITLEESAPIYIFRDCAFLLVFLYYTEQASGQFSTTRSPDDIDLRAHMLCSRQIIQSEQCLKFRPYGAVEKFDFYYSRRRRRYSGANIASRCRDGCGCVLLAW